MINIVLLFISDLGDDLFNVQSELNEVAENWRSIGIALRLKSDFLQNIEVRYSNHPRTCLTWMLMEWLMRNYNVERFGEPTWRQLVEAVGHPAGGANMTLARNIARRHKAASGANIAVGGETTRKRKPASGANVAVTGETTKKHKAASGANVAVTGETTKKRKAASGANVAVTGKTTKKRKAGSGANITVTGKTTKKRKAASGANVVVTGETTKKRKAGSGANEANNRCKPEGMSSCDALSL